MPIFLLLGSRLSLAFHSIGAFGYEKKQNELSCLVVQFAIS
jgi:hypothetical protein